MNEAKCRTAPRLQFTPTDGNVSIIPGIAEVHAAPHRRRREAQAFAERIAREPAAYLDVLNAFGVGGIFDRRPESHVRGGTPFSNVADLRSPHRPVAVPGGHRVKPCTLTRQPGERVWP